MELIAQNLKVGGFYVLIGFNSFKEALSKKGLTNSAALANYILETYKVALLSGEDFQFTPDELFFRLAYTLILMEELR